MRKCGFGGRLDCRVVQHLVGFFSTTRTVLAGSGCPRAPHRGSASAVESPSGPAEIEGGDVAPEPAGCRRRARGPVPPGPAPGGAAAERLGTPPFVSGVGGVSDG